VGFRPFSSARHRLRPLPIECRTKCRPTKAPAFNAALPCDEAAIMDGEAQLLARITTNPEIFGGKPIVRGRRLAVEHVLGMLAAGDTPDTILQGYDWLEPEDIRACLLYARRVVGHERVEPALTDR